MLLIPDSDTAVVDPFRTRKTLAINCFVQDPLTGESYTRDPRYVCARRPSYLQSTGIADTAYFGPEAEFFIFDDVRFDQNEHSAFYHVDSVEGAWNTGRERAARTSATRSATRRATSPSRPPTSSRTSARR